MPDGNLFDCDRDSSKWRSHRFLRTFHSLFRTKPVKTSLYYTFLALSLLLSIDFYFLVKKPNSGVVSSYSNDTFC